MSEATETNYVAKEENYRELSTYWNKAKNGEAQAVLLSAPLGGGKRAMVGQLCRDAKLESEDIIVARPSFSDEEAGQGALVKLYASLYGGIHSVNTLRGRIEMALTSQIPGKHPRVQNWFQRFMEGMKQSVPKAGEQQFKVVIPTDNPLVAYIEIILGISKRFPIILDLQNIHATHSLPVIATLNALINELKTREDLKLMVIMQSLPVEGNEDWISEPLQDILERAENVTKLTLDPWENIEINAFLESREQKEHIHLSSKIAELTRGRPGFIAELADWLREDEDLSTRLPGLYLEDLIDLSPDEEELYDSSEESSSSEEEQEAPENANAPERKKATPADAADIAFIAALLGISFPSGVVADMGNYERNSVDDLLDATEQAYKELQHSKPLNTWVYQFRKALIREAIISSRTSDEDKQVAQRVGMFMERFLVPLGYGYLTKTLRHYADYGVDSRANLLRMNAMRADNVQFWSLAQDCYNWFDDCSWPDNMRRVTFLNLAEQLSNAGQVEGTEKLLQEAFTWTKQQQAKQADAPEEEGATDKERNVYQALEGQLMMIGSRNDRNRQDLYRARDRAITAQGIFNGLGEQVAHAQATAHLGMIELADGKNNAALERAKEAEQLSEHGNITAMVHSIRAHVAQREGKLTDAIEQFSQANKKAGEIGNAPLALESGLKLGETLLMSKQFPQAADVLRQISGMAQQVKNPVVERASCDMLAKAHANTRQFEAALTAASRALQITQKMQWAKLEPMDLYNVGLFNLMLGRHSEAAAIFTDAKGKLPGNANPNFEKEILFNLGMARLQIGEISAAEQNIRAAMPKASALKDWDKVLVGHKQLAVIAQRNGNIDQAKKELEAAQLVAEQTNRPEERKAIKDLIRDLRRA